MVLSKTLEEDLEDAKQLLLEIDVMFPEPPKKVPTKSVGYWHGRDHARSCVDESWSPLLRWAVVGYLSAGTAHRRWRGFAHCRICPKTDNGSVDLTDGDWIWPEGYAHYLTQHGVKPPAEFIAHVMEKIGFEK